jgi:hypothetical protein
MKICCRKSFLCEFSGKLVDEFTNCLKPHVDGLPILVLQFVKIGRSQGFLVFLKLYTESNLNYSSVFPNLTYILGSVLVEGVQGVTRMFADPIDSVAVWNFKKRLPSFTTVLLLFFHMSCLLCVDFLCVCSLVKFLSANFDYSGLYRPTTRVPVSYTMEFLKDHPIRTMAELKSNPELGYFIVNARLSDIVSFDPWWYAMCDCPRVDATKCKADKWSPSPKYVRFYLCFMFYNLLYLHFVMHLI